MAKSGDQHTQRLKLTDSPERQTSVRHRTLAKAASDACSPREGARRMEEHPYVAKSRIGVGTGSQLAWLAERNLDLERSTLGHQHDPSRLPDAFRHHASDRNAQRGENFRRRLVVVPAFGSQAD